MIPVENKSRNLEMVTFRKAEAHCRQVDRKQWFISLRCWKKAWLYRKLIINL